MKRLSFVLLVLAFTLSAFAAELPRRPWLGCTVRPVPDSLRSRIEPKYSGGIVLGAPAPNSSAEAGGLKEGDIVLSLGGKPVPTVPIFLTVMKQSGTKKPVAFEILRDGQKIKKSFKLKPYPKETGDTYDVLYESVAVDNSLHRVIITKPKTPGKHPVILLVGGIGCYSLDLLPGTPHPYLEILHEFTENSFVTVRVEKSGMGDSEGQPCPDVDFKTELKGYVACAKALGSHSFMDTSNVILLGHSMGGILAPLVYNQYPVKGVIAMATSPISWFEYELTNQRRQLVLQHMDYDSVEIQAKEKELAMHELMVEKKTPEEILKEHPGFSDYLQYPASYSYMQQLSDLNMAHEWKSVSAQLLVVYGLSDFVTCPEDHRYLTDMVNYYHPGHAKYVEIKSMDHFMDKTATQQESFDNSSAGRPNKEFASQVIPELLNWSKSVVGMN
jgi:hypothetical protein